METDIELVLTTSDLHCGLERSSIDEQTRRRYNPTAACNRDGFIHSVRQSEIVRRDDESLHDLPTWNKGHLQGCALLRNEGHLRCRFACPKICDEDFGRETRAADQIGKVQNTIRLGDVQSFDR